jgi:hypothetical protein
LKYLNEVLKPFEKLECFVTKQETGKAELYVPRVMAHLIKSGVIPAERCEAFEKMLPAPTSYQNGHDSAQCNTNCDILVDLSDTSADTKVSAARRNIFDDDLISLNDLIPSLL